MHRFASLLFAAWAAAQPQQYFADVRKASFPLFDALTTQLFVADVNGDGRPDLVPGSISYARYQLGWPLVYWNRGRGRFEPGQMDSSWYPSLGVGDLDQDGDIDLVNADGAFRNDGQERFTAVPTAWSSTPGWTDRDRFAVADVNGDGRLDVCTGQVQGRLWLNLGGLSFSDASAFVPSEMVGNPTLADLDGDGDLDLLTFDSGVTAPARLALNDGAGRFTLVPAARFPAPARDVRDVAIADFDGNLGIDIVLVGPQGPALLMNSGSGTFSDQTGRLNTSIPAHAVAAGDVDGDRDIDLVFGGGVHLNQGGSFAAAQNAWQPTPGPILDVVLFDGDQDGDLDLVEARGEDLNSRDGHGMANHVAWNDGRGRFRAGVVPPIPMSTQAGGAALGDLNGDGVPDLLIGDGGVRSLMGDGRGGFRAPRSLQLPVRGQPALGDLDGDGDLDAVLVDALAFHVLNNPGDGSLQPTISIFYSGLGQGAAGTDGVLGDFDGNGTLDLVVATVGRRHPTGVFTGESELLYRGDGRGAFALLPTVLPGATASFDIVAGDLDGDGDLDVVVDGLMTYLNTGTGFVPTPYWHGEYAGRSSVQLADLDGDGDLDLACGNGCYSSWLSCDRFTDSPRETVLWNDGRGAFPQHQVLPWPLSNTRSTAVGDIDEDGDIDVVFGNIDYPNTPTDQLFLNDGNRSFSDARTAQPPYDGFPWDTGDTHQLFLADLDFDGDLDLVAIDDSPGESGYPASRVFVNLTRHLRAPDLARLGLPYRLWLEGGTQGAALLLAAGPGQLSTPFGHFGLDVASTIIAGTFGPPSQGRRVAIEPTLPANPSLLDATLWWQGAVLANQTLRLTNVVADQISW